jgi:hypothetical protein
MTCINALRRVCSFDLGSPSGSTLYYKIRGVSEGLFGGNK